ncbi:DNA topoisomerase IB [Nesterenkonia lutea]|uniref:DNA topoisomerase n=1 Tax=Nesterenkonia lutea TaxID=272919 RepID=A0ABR9JHK8_9MICC|nr:DNA topoisomerase IB [Nesterenkonia lutea]MBE1525419.1 DNA topoisomerase IB [Nesterenkonia lutea]
MPRVKRVRPGREPGIQRIRDGSDFTYRTDAGHPVGAADLERIESLVIPPAWTEVWICSQPNGHVQAVGTDQAGRRQYLYHAGWTSRRDRGKHAKALTLAAALPRARARVTRALRAGAMDRELVLATSFRLLDVSALRVGSTRHLARTGSRGLTTLQCRHVSVEGSRISFTFPGKSGRRQTIEIEDQELARAITGLAAAGPRSPLLAWHEGRRRVAVSPQQVNAYVRELTGGRFTAKDFRTLRGTIIAAQKLADIGAASTRRERDRAEREAAAAVAQQLGNTPAVARGSYIDPRVFTRYRQGEVLDTTRAPESALRSLLLKK